MNTTITNEKGHSNMGEHRRPANSSHDENNRSVTSDSRRESGSCPMGGRGSHLTLSPRQSLTDVDAEFSHLNVGSDNQGTIKSSRDVVLKAEAANRKAGHENNGYLSFSHGFAPRIAPITRFPPEFQAWNDLCAELPSLLSSGKLRMYCDDLPVLDAKKLPPAFALRAANVLGFAAHAYWNIDDVPKGRSLAPGLEVPWKEINGFHLGRSGPAFLGIIEMTIGNFQFEDGKVPPPPAYAEACPWASEEMAKYGAVEYDPAKATISTFQPSLSLTGLKEEHIFYGVMKEMHTLGAPIVSLTVEAQEAILSNNTAQLKRTLQSVLELLTTLTFDSFNKIQQQRLGPHFVDAALWCKVVAPIPVPFTSTTFGPSGTAVPMIHLLDALFGRIKYEKFIGKEVEGLFHSFPPHWKEFISSVWQGPSIREYVQTSEDRELQGLFGAALQMYVSKNGFLGRHKLKTVGYLEIAMKLGRSVTIGGFAGLLKDRAWDKIGDELEVGQDERYAGVGTKLLCNEGTIIRSNDISAPSTQSARRVRINIEGSGIRYEAGSHVGVLYESSCHEVFSTLLAFANGDHAKASSIGEEVKVMLTPKWKQALRYRQEYHGTSPPDYLKLSTLLKYAALRPATRQMLNLAYDASLSEDVLRILNGGLDSAVTFSDVVTILRREGVDLLSNSRSEGSSRKIHSLQTANGERRVSLTKLKSSLNKKGLGRGAKLESDPERGGEKATNEHSIPSLCDILEPAGFRLYSIASSPTVHPTELHLYIQPVAYESKSAVAQTCPLFADSQDLVRHRGAASDYLVSNSLQRYQLAIQALRDELGHHERGSVNISFACEKILKTQTRAHINDEEMNAIIGQVQNGSDGSKEVTVANIIKVIEQELKDKPDPRESSVVLMHSASPRFRLPGKTDMPPCIMIAGGTGLAPFRSFWQVLAQSGKLSHGQKHLLLIQQRTRFSMAFEDEILPLVHDGILDVEIIFSRDDCVPVFDGNEISYQDLPGRSGYIDKVIAEEDMQARLASMIRDHSGCVYICGRGGLAKTAVGALELCLCNAYGDEAGQEELERLVAENRLVLDIFTGLSPPSVREVMDLSELCQCNDFAGVRGKNKPLRLVVNSVVYDMGKLFRFHPGGDTLLKLYCGMDATKAWEAVKHDKMPEVVAMLEMFDTNLALREVASGLSLSDKLWYEKGWKEMTMLLVEIQNAITLAFERNWDKGAFSSAEEQMGSHFTVWEGDVVWRPKRSNLKGSFFIDTHSRIWSKFLPLLLSGPFDEIRVGPVGLDSNLVVQTSQLIIDMENSRDHFVCDSAASLMKEELEKACAEKNMFLPPSLQAYMEELRKVDDALLEDIKARLVCGLKVFETSPKSPVLPEYHQIFNRSIEGIIGDVESYMSKVSSLTMSAFGSDRAHAASTRPDLKRGGLALLHSSSLDTVGRDLIDIKDTQAKVLGSDVDVDHKLDVLTVCPHAA